MGEAMYYAPRPKLLKLRFIVGTSCTGTLYTYIQDIGVRPPRANLPGELDSSPGRNKLAIWPLSSTLI